MKLKTILKHLGKAVNKLCEIMISIAVGSMMAMMLYLLYYLSSNPDFITPNYFKISALVIAGLASLYFIGEGIRK